MPARLLVKEPTQTTERPPEELSELRDRPCWLDISDPQSKDFALAAQELKLHPLAVEDSQQRHERPKIDQYDDHYFIVFYALEEPSPGVVREVEISIFMLQNAIVTVHDGDFTARAAVEKRFREGKLQTTGLLLHALLDTIVDQYFKIVDALGDRVELLESMVVGGEQPDYDTSIRELFVLKRDLVRIRHLIAPERDVLTVLVRGDIRELRETGRRVYFQDVYDHISRVTDEIDTFRELTSNVIDAHLASVSNRLNEVVKVLTSMATVLLVLTVVTGFFGQNWKFIPYDSEPLFFASLIFMLLVAVGTALYFRRKGWL
ncbi:MAG TPA: magnesium/cobalt transporter CorA [Candidatus Limnocylindria bacterium]|nr:magnesium/cobalt transporter CorA [Candidatus Limnocylindria bacterium]